MQTYLPYLYLLRYFKYLQLQFKTSQRGKSIMQEHNQEDNNIDRDERGNPVMSVRTIKYFCLKESLQERPDLNEKLYLNHKRFKAISSLQSYHNLVTLWLNDNLISRIEGLEDLKNLECLYLQNNLIEKMENLSSLKKLNLLNVGNNRIKKIEGIINLESLKCLCLTQNLLKDEYSLKGILDCPGISSLDLSNTKIQNDEQVLKILLKMQNINCLYLKSTPLARGLKNYRKLLIGSFKKLKFLDDRPVQETDHRIYEAWMRGGIDAQREEREKVVLEKQTKIAKNETKVEENFSSQPKETSPLKITAKERNGSIPIKPKVKQQPKKEKQIHKNEEPEIEEQNLVIQDQQSKKISLENWKQQYTPLLQTLVIKYKFDFQQVQPSFNMIMSNINKKMNRVHRRFQISELQKIWTIIEIKKRQGSLPL